MISVFWHLREKVTRIELKPVNNGDQPFSSIILVPSYLFGRSYLLWSCCFYYHTFLDGLLTNFWFSQCANITVHCSWYYSIYFLFGIVRRSIIVVVKLQNGIKTRIGHVTKNRIRNFMVSSHYSVHCSTSYNEKGDRYQSLKNHCNYCKFTWNLNLKFRTSLFLSIELSFESKKLFQLR